MRSPLPRPLPKPRLLLASSWVKGTRYQPQQAGHTGGGSSSRHRAQPVRRGVPARPWARRRGLEGCRGRRRAGVAWPLWIRLRRGVGNETRATCARVGGRGPDRAGLVTRVRGRGFVVWGGVRWGVVCGGLGRGSGKKDGVQNYSEYPTRSLDVPFPRWIMNTLLRYYPYFTGEETEAQKRCVTSRRSKFSKPGLNST